MQLLTTFKDNTVYTFQLKSLQHNVILLRFFSENMKKLISGKSAGQNIFQKKKKKQAGAGRCLFGTEE